MSTKLRTGWSIVFETGTGNHTQSIKSGFRSYESATVYARLLNSQPGVRTGHKAAAIGTANSLDRKAGYDVCMFCEETGSAETHGSHDVLWDRMLDSQNAAF